MEGFFGGLALMFISALAFAAWNAPKVFVFLFAVCFVGTIVAGVWVIGYDHGLERAAGIIELAKSRAEAAKALESASIYRWFDVGGIVFIIYLIVLAVVADDRDPYLRMLLDRAKPNEPGSREQPKGEQRGDSGSRLPPKRLPDDKL